MREKDIKILWGRSGNRCAICKLELTPDGNDFTLGEMAHIVSRSPDGPRGLADIPIAERDDYSNLMLLCPNHHKEIDKNELQWSRAELLRRKAEHERWVSEQLEQGKLSFSAIDNSEFIEARLKEWLSYTTGRVWMAMSITPLRVSSEILNPLEDRFVEILNSLRIPSERYESESVNAYHTRPNENGLVNEDMRSLKDGFGTRIQVFRNGHCEFLYCVQWSVDQIMGYAKTRDAAAIGANKVIRYTVLADTLVKGLIGLKTIWAKCLSLKDMTLNVAALNTSSTILYSRETDWDGALYGFPVKSPFLRHAEIINSEDEIMEVVSLVISRFVNFFGLVIDGLYDNQGEFKRPQKM